MITRVGDASDYDTVVPMMRQHRLRQQGLDPALYAPHPDADRRLRRWVGTVAQDPRATLLVVEDEAQVVGFLYATVEKEMPVFQVEEYALVHEWWVEPGFRGRGAGRLLIQRACAEFAQAGVRQLRVRLAAADHEALAALHRCGFRTGVCELVRELSTSNK